MPHNKQSIRVVVFACNEQALISTALGSVLVESAAWAQVRIYVLVNGSKDRTLSIVRDLAVEYPQIVPVELNIGDKCNAWNHYVHELADDAPVHFFMDGDVRVGPGSLRAMNDTLLGSPKAQAMAGVPLSGRNRQEYLRYVKDWHWLYGNLYAVKAEQIASIRRLGIRLPLGLFGNDHMIAKIMRTRLERGLDENYSQIIHRADTGYVFDSLQPHRLSDWRIYINRLIRYRWRRMQLERLDPLPITELPRTMDGINRDILTELNKRRLIRPMDWALRRRLRWRYPRPNAAYYDQMLATAADGSPDSAVSNVLTPR